MKLAKTVKETLRNEILFCRKGETGMTGVLWQKIMTSTYFFDLVAADAILSILIAMFFSHDHHLHNLATESPLYKVIRVVDAFYSI